MRAMSNGSLVAPIAVIPRPTWDSLTFGDMGGLRVGIAMTFWGRRSVGLVDGWRSLGHYDGGGRRLVFVLGLFCFYYLLDGGF